MPISAISLDMIYFTTISFTNENAVVSLTRNPAAGSMTSEELRHDTNKLIDVVVAYFCSILLIQQIFVYQPENSDKFMSSSIKGLGREGYSMLKCYSQCVPHIKKLD